MVVFFNEIVSCIDSCGYVFGIGYKWVCFCCIFGDVGDIGGI